jgi:PAS domain S-box-containing protein
VSAATEGDRHREWVETWRAAVRASSSAVGLVELPDTRFLELSPAAAALLGTTPAEGIGLDYLAVVERPQESELSIRLVTMGGVDAVHARRRYRRPDGSIVDVPALGRAVRSREGRDLGLWIAGDAATREGSAGPDPVMEESSHGAKIERDDPSPPRARLDSHWRVEQIDTDDDQVLGYRPAELVGASLIALVHPDDLAVLMLVFARATTGVDVREQLRLRHRDGTWRAVTVLISSLEGDGPVLFSLALADADVSASLGSRVRRLEHHLMRIALELQAAGVVVGPIDANRLSLASTMSGLSARQHEVLSRLLRGERVPRIAKAMYLSQSTVRNHLSAIFRKAGVHSQEALLALLRSRTPVNPTAE